MHPQVIFFYTLFVDVLLFVLLYFSVVCLRTLKQAGYDIMKAATLAPFHNYKVGCCSHHYILILPP